jgi:hypothetical protein
MRGQMRPAHSLFRVFFILYCMEAGVFLLFAPWSAGWGRAALQLANPALRTLALHPLFRSALSGFGLVHLVWSMHDLTALIERWRWGANPGRR